MASLGEQAHALQQRWFVGRERDLAELDAWLGDSGAPTPIRNLVGPGGMGKSWLLERFVARAASAGWPVVLVRGQLVTSAEQLRAQAGPPPPGPVLLAVDTVEKLDALAAELQEVVSALAEGSRVLLAGRRALGGSWHGWRSLIATQPLGRLGMSEQREYLRRRGVTDVALAVRVVGQCGGHPLTLSLAADLVLLGGSAALDASGSWSAAVSGVVTGLRSELEPPVAALLEAAAVLGSFDRAALLATVGDPDLAPWVTQLTTLSWVSGHAGRFEVHEDVRRSLLEDLRLHRPERLQALRTRGFRHYRRAAATSSRGGAAEAAAAAAVLILALGMPELAAYVPEDDSLTVEFAGPAQLAEVVALQQRFPGYIHPPPGERDPALLEALLADPEAEVLLLRGADGAALGYVFRLPFGIRTAQVLRRFPDLCDVMTVAWAALGGPPVLEERSALYYWGTVCLPGGDPMHYARLGGTAVDELAAEGAYVALTADPVYVQAVLALGGRRLPYSVPAGEVELLAYLIDLSRVGLAAWLHATAAGTPLPQLPEGEELHRVVAEAVEAFGDDAALAGSPLVAFAEPDPTVAVADRASAVRDLLWSGLHTTRPWPSPQRRIAEALSAVGIADLPSAPEAGERRRQPRPAPLRAPAVRVLGDLDVVLGPGRQQVTASELGPVSARALAVLVTLGPVTVEQLADILWPDARTEASRARVNQTLYRLRAALGTDPVERAGGRLRLATGVSSDLQCFEERAALALRGGPGAEAAAKRALAAYGGDLLPGYLYEEWTIAPRERVRRRYLALLDLLAAEAARRGATAEAVARLEQAIELDRFDQDRYLTAARLLAKRGWRSRALALCRAAAATAATLGLPLLGDLSDLEATLRLGWL